MDDIENIKKSRRRRIAEEIADILREKDLSKKDFAAMMHRQPSDVTKWLKGDHNFTSDLLAEISEVLGKDITGVEASASKPVSSVVDGYDSQSGRDRLCEPDTAYALIEVPRDLYDDLVYLSKSEGETLRDFLKRIVVEKKEAKATSAKDFYGIWGEDFPDAEELRSFRTHNTFPET